MQIDTEHLHYYMNAIRQSPDPLRTLDAFYNGQIKSKEWLINTLELLYKFDKPLSIDIHGGWVGVLASLLFQSKLPIKNIRSVDIDPTVEPIAMEMNRKEVIEGRFKAITCNMIDIRSDCDIIINTSCEHITQDEYDLWYSGLPHNSIIICQGNNYDIPEHVRISKDIDMFEKQCSLNRKFVGTLNLPLYNRYMIIGKKNG